MKKNIIYFLVYLSSIQISFAQLNVGGIPASWNKIELNDKITSFSPSYIAGFIDWKKIKEEDYKDSLNDSPPRFGYDFSVNIDIMQSGNKTITMEGNQITTYKFLCKGALSINLLYNKFWLPQGAVLHIYKSDKKQVIGGFTNINNKGGKDNIKGFGTGLLYGEEIVLELFEPKNIINQSVINIAKVIYGYRKIRLPKAFENTEAFGGSGSCQVNVNCAEGNNWQNEKRGIAMILVNGNRYCTGSIVRSNVDNGELYFLTADHCLGGWANPTIKDAISNPDCPEWSFVWNYESAGCTNPATEPSTTQTTAGATLVANWSNTDFALFRLTESPFMLPTPYNAFFNGWTRSTTITSAGAGIHHPSGDIKKIATFTTTPAASQSVTSVPGGINSNYWQVAWAATTNGHSVTEGGSSGSPLFNSSGNITGQLYGGSSINCTDPANDPGVYGKFSVSWNAGSSAQRRLKDWLDPTNVSPSSLSGANAPCNSSFVLSSNVTNNRFVQALSIQTSIFFSSTVSVDGNLHLRASNEIILRPGFNCTGSMRAYIAPCF
jgi:lysyl endopeptidase